MIVRELLLALNQKSIKENIKYMLEYVYQYNPKQDRVFQQTLVIKFGWDHKVLNKTQVRNDVETISFLQQELNAYK